MGRGIRESVFVARLPSWLARLTRAMTMNGRSWRLGGLAFQVFGFSVPMDLRVMPGGDELGGGPGAATVAQSRARFAIRRLDGSR